jgi:Fe2+ or Zn2+ uptake regulation protein
MTHSTQTELRLSKAADAIVSGLQGQGFRRTVALSKLIREMVAHPAPASIPQWARRKNLRGVSPVTVYRLMMKLLDAAVVRRVHLRDRAQCFELSSQGAVPDYLVCTKCGELQRVSAPAELRQMEKQLATDSGWRVLRYELEFFGVCPDCTGTDDKHHS